MTVQLDEFKTRQRAVWAAGDYATLSQHIADVGERVVARAEIEPGMPVLDVACGAGNAAIPAARAGGQVTGLDLVPKLLEEGRAKADAAGVEVEWVEGDAEELPFEDERHVNRIEWDSIEGWADYFMEQFPPMVTARAMLGERFGELREQIVAIWRDASEADDGSLRLPQEYLLSIVRP